MEPTSQICATSAETIIKTTLNSFKTVICSVLKVEGVFLDNGKKASGLYESAHNQGITKFLANCCKKKGTRTQLDQSDYKQSLLLLLHSLFGIKVQCNNFKG